LWIAAYALVFWCRHVGARFRLAAGRHDAVAPSGAVPRGFEACVTHDASENRADDPGVGTAEKPHTPEEAARLSRVTPQSKLRPTLHATRVTSDAPAKRGWGGACRSFRGGSAALKARCCASGRTTEFPTPPRARAGRRMRFAATQLIKDLCRGGQFVSCTAKRATRSARSGTRRCGTCSRGRPPANEPCRTRFAKHGINASSPRRGEPFDPNQHQAMFEVDGSELSRHHRADVLPATPTTNG